MPRVGRRTLSPARALALAFGGAILLGSVLLTLPWASATGQPTPLLTALFTATSAVCVTGLVVVDTGTYWSGAGQALILVLIQLGGIGVMTASSLVMLLAGQRPSLGTRLVLSEQFGGVQLSAATALIGRVAAVTVGVQLVGTLALTGVWWGRLAPAQALRLATFHSISAFNNAGFDLFSDSLEGFSGDPLTLGVISLLVVVGGIGFMVLADLFQRARHRRPLQLHTRVILMTTAALLLLGAALILVAESGPGGALASAGTAERLGASWFHSVTPRTAGFNALRPGEMTPASQLATMVLMFIGGSPGSTAGGVKTAVLAVLVLTLVNGLVGKRDLEVLHRRLPWQVVNRALAVVILAAVLVLLVTTALLLTEGAGLVETLFEATSAFGTVGLSMGLTDQLSPAGQTIIMLTMFSGRLGPLTLALAIATRQRRGVSIRKPKDSIILG